ncbi:MAG: type II toxin-antitoxin system HicB family antitoxin [Candidatus Sungbacteria bacterium]|nr:type II toxin-antitoxin system HicB family antitoxin [Candidatus Sungbacteria bacterium]
MRHSYTFKTIIRRGQDGYWIASVPALPGCHTQAKTYEELRKRIKEAIGLCLEAAKEDHSYRLTSQPVFIGMEDVAVRV